MRLKFWESFLSRKNHSFNFAEMKIYNQVIVLDTTAATDFTKFNRCLVYLHRRVIRQLSKSSALSCEKRLSLWFEHGWQIDSRL